MKENKLALDRNDDLEDLIVIRPRGDFPLDPLFCLRIIPIVQIDNYPSAGRGVLQHVRSTTSSTEHHTSRECIREKYNEEY